MSAMIEEKVKTKIKLFKLGLIFSQKGTSSCFSMIGSAKKDAGGLSNGLLEGLPTGPEDEVNGLAGFPDLGAKGLVAGDAEVPAKGLEGLAGLWEEAKGLVVDTVELPAKGLAAGLEVGGLLANGLDAGEAGVGVSEGELGESGAGVVVELLGRGIFFLGFCLASAVPKSAGSGVRRRAWNPGLGTGSSSSSTAAFTLNPWYVFCFVTRTGCARPCLLRLSAEVGFELCSN